MSKKKTYHDIETGDRNARCYCGSGLKYKKCHMFTDQGYVKNPDGHLERIADYTTPAKIAVDNAQ